MILFEFPGSAHSNPKTLLDCCFIVPNECVEESNSMICACDTMYIGCTLRHPIRGTRGRSDGSRSPCSPLAPHTERQVEKSCRLLKHSMRCVPDLFKPNLSDVARTLVTAFQQHQHSSYLYSAEILAHTYAKDPEIVPVLTELFNQLSSIGLQCLMHSKDKLEEITELVEDSWTSKRPRMATVFAPQTSILSSPSSPRHSKGDLYESAFHRDRYSSTGVNK